MADYEITILIEEVGDELELRVTAEAAGAGLPGTQVDQRTRRLQPGHKNDVKRQKKDRHNGNHKNDDVIGPHLPVFVINHTTPAHNDRVRFQCAADFVVDMSLDDGFDPPPGNAPPQNPFGWLTPQSGAAAADVVGTINKASFPNGPRMDFYKCTVWCNGKKLDPDFICEAGP